MSLWVNNSGNLLIGVAGALLDCDYCPCGPEPPAPNSCPCISWPPTSWPCERLNQTYWVTFHYRSVICSGPGCTSGCTVCEEDLDIIVTAYEGRQCTWYGGDPFSTCLPYSQIELYLDAGKWVLYVPGLAAALMVYSEKTTGLTPVGIYPDAEQGCLYIPPFGQSFNSWISNIIVS